MDDIGLLQRAGRGDADAFSRLFARFQGPIFRYAAHMCGRAAADDVVQETFLAVLRQNGRYDANRGTVGNYLFGIARHCVFARLSPRELTGFDVESDDAGGPSRTTGGADLLESLTRAETIDAVREAVAALPAVYREVIVLCELQEMSYVSAAAIIECPIGTVRSRLHRARALLATKLSAVAPPAAARG